MWRVRRYCVMPPRLISLAIDKNYCIQHFLRHVQLLFELPHRSHLLLMRSVFLPSLQDNRIWYSFTFEEHTTPSHVLTIPSHARLPRGSGTFLIHLLCPILVVSMTAAPQCLTDFAVFVYPVTLTEASFFVAAFMAFWSTVHHELCF